ncbi:PREDICTED: ras-related and estrogen-regulated growth inhibitor-like, partial [Priapulus caudatus]|uniref:small monomeric GTPase n=1 Tax=Priapulus caudatus TaxID=37621 RepID=A0ABM1EYD0_PRICU
LVVRFLTREVHLGIRPTLEWTYRHQTVIDGDSVILEILDTAGQDEYSHKEGQVKWGDAFLLVYSITDRDSFDQISGVKKFIEETKCSMAVPCIIVGNKSDLDHIRQVPKEEGENLASELGCGFYECSACDGDVAVFDAFLELHRDARRRRMLDTRGRRRSSTAAQQVINVLNKVFHKEKEKNHS